MGNNNEKNVVNEYTVSQRQDVWGNLIVNTTLTMQDYSGLYGTAEVINGCVLLGNYAFINSLYMPNGGEIFFTGKKPCIRMLQANGLIVHISKNCERWTDFVQIQHVTNVKVIRDIT